MSIGITEKYIAFGRLRILIRLTGIRIKELLSTLEVLKPLKSYLLLQATLSYLLLFKFLQKR